MKKISKSVRKFLTLLLAITLVITLCPVSSLIAFAEGGNVPATQTDLDGEPQGEPEPESKDVPDGNAPDGENGSGSNNEPGGGKPNNDDSDGNNNPDGNDGSIGNTPDGNGDSNGDDVSGGDNPDGNTPGGNGDSDSGDTPDGGAASGESGNPGNNDGQSGNDLGGGADSGGNGNSDGNNGTDGNGNSDGNNDTDGNDTSDGNGNSDGNDNPDGGNPDGNNPNGDGNSDGNDGTGGDETETATITWVSKKQNADGSLSDVTTSKELPIGSNPLSYFPETPDFYTNTTVYNFVQWSPEIINVDGDRTYTAIYDSFTRMYTIIWKVLWQENEGDDVEELTVSRDFEYGSSLADYLPVPKKKLVTADNTYTYTGWSPAIHDVDGDQTYEAQYTITPNQEELFTITWITTEQDSDGMLVDVRTSKQYPLGASLDGEFPEVIETFLTESEVFTFTNWSPEPHEVTGDQTYRADYRSVPRPYNITWKWQVLDAEGSVVETSKTESLEYGMDAAEYSPEVTSPLMTASEILTFTGWTPEVGGVFGEETYTAVYKSEPRKYPISWEWLDLDPEGGLDTIYFTESLAYGTDVSDHIPAAPDEIVYDGTIYTRKGWTPEFEAVAGEKTYKAEYETKEITCLITWLDDEGELIDITEVPYGEVPTHDDPTKDPTEDTEYVFTGWNPTPVEAKGDASYMATFEEKSKGCVISWVTTVQNEDGTLSTETTSKTYNYGATLDGEFPAVIEKFETVDSVCTFVEWSPEPHAVDGDETYTAVYKSEPRKYPISWEWLDLDPEGKLDTIYFTESLAYGTDVSDHIPAAPDEIVYDGTIYTRKGWTPEFEAVAGEKTYKAEYETEEITYLITWLDDEGEPIDITEVPYGEVPTHDDPTKDPTENTVYIFMGWDPEPVKADGDTSYMAMFAATEREYSVTWKNYDGSVLETDKVKFGETPSYDSETPKKPEDAQYSYSFIGWTPELAPVTKDVVYTAEFDVTVKSYTIAWYGEDEEKPLEVQSLPYGATPEYSGETPTKAATKDYTYTFAGWEPEVVPVVADANYKAKFTAKSTYVAPPMTPEERSAKMNRKFKVYFGETPNPVEKEPALVVEWGQASGVNTYEVYAWYMNEDEPTTPIMKVSYSAFAVYLTDLNEEKIDFGGCCAVYVVAKNRRGEEVGRTVVAYVAGPDNPDYTNPVSLTVDSGNTVGLKKEQSFNIQATVVFEDPTKKPIPGVPELRYVSSKDSVATVSEDGEIIAVGRGSCIVQVFTANALVEEIKVTVK